MCETWIMVAFIGWLPPFRIDGFQTEDACQRSGQVVSSYCQKIEELKGSQTCSGAHYCIPGAPAPCNPVK